MLRTSSGILRPRNFSSTGRMLLPAMTWKRPALRMKLWAYRISPAEITRMADKIVAVLIALKLPAL